jgi:predicted dehydrogenase
LKTVSRLYPAVETTTDSSLAFNRPDIDAVIIATPLSTHYPLARKALEKGKHVLVEKPMVHTVRQAEALADLAVRKKRVLMVDHTFLYTGAIRKIRSLIDSGNTGKIRYFDSTRINLGLFQNDVNVLWDLAPHDLSILNYLHKESPESVVATGISHTDSGFEDMAYITFFYQSNMIAHFNCSWVSPVKIRKVLIGGEQRMIVYDDLEPTEKVKIYDYGYKVRTDWQKNKMLVDYRVGDISVPQLDRTEALRGVTDDFIQSIETGKEPVSGWRSGLAVIRLLEAAQKSLRRKGREVAVG